MSKTMLLTNDVPQYIRDIVKNLRVDTQYSDGDVPGYTFRLYGKHKVGYESQLQNDCDRLVDWCKKYHADAFVLGKHFWYTDVSVPGGVARGAAHQAKAYREGFRNFIKLVITDPVAYRFEKDGFYREREPLNKQIGAAEGQKTVLATKKDISRSVDRG